MSDDSLIITPDGIPNGTLDGAADLIAAIANRLRTRGWLLATAESCTGGSIAQLLTAQAGASTWFDSGLITYSNIAKVRLLNVPLEVLTTYGAVSEETAAAMARGALHTQQVQVALSVTGIAGPAGGTPQKPVGTVCFGWAMTDASQSTQAQVLTQTKHFSGDRAAVRAASAVHSLLGLLRMLEGNH